MNNFKIVTLLVILFVIFNLSYSARYTTTRSISARRTTARYIVTRKSLVQRTTPRYFTTKRSVVLRTTTRYVTRRPATPKTTQRYVATRKPVTRRTTPRYFDTTKPVTRRTTPRYVTARKPIAQRTTRRHFTTTTPKPIWVGRRVIVLWESARTTTRRPRTTSRPRRRPTTRTTRSTTTRTTTTTTTASPYPVHDPAIQKINMGPNYYQPPPTYPPLYPVQASPFRPYQTAPVIINRPVFVDPTSYYTRRDNTILGMYLARRADRVSYRGDYVQAYPTYAVVHHYHHYDRPIPKQIMVQESTLAECGTLSEVCALNTTPLCLTNGTVFCITSMKATAPCVVNGENLTCINTTSKNTLTEIPSNVSIPCISNMRTISDRMGYNATSIPFANNSSIVHNKTIARNTSLETSMPIPTLTVHTSSVQNSTNTTTTNTTGNADDVQNLGNNTNPSKTAQINQKCNNSTLTQNLTNNTNTTDNADVVQTLCDTSNAPNTTQLNQESNNTTLTHNLTNDTNTTAVSQNLIENATLPNTTEPSQEISNTNVAQNFDSTTITAELTPYTDSTANSTDYTQKNTNDSATYPHQNITLSNITSTGQAQINSTIFNLTPNPLPNLTLAESTTSINSTTNNHAFANNTDLSINATAGNQTNVSNSKPTETRYTIGNEGVTDMYCVAYIAEPLPQAKKMKNSEFVDHVSKTRELAEFLEAKVENVFKRFLLSIFS